MDFDLKLIESPEGRLQILFIQLKWLDTEMWKFSDQRNLIRCDITWLDNKITYKLFVKIF